MQKVLLQDVLDVFVRTSPSEKEDHRATEDCMEALADYLLHYSDLFQDGDAPEDMKMEEWEESLEIYMAQLMKGDMDVPVDLGTLDMAELEPEHLQDFLGWYLLRELSGDSQSIKEYCAVLRDWIAFCAKREWISAEKAMDFMDVLTDMEPDVLRAAKVAHVLFYYVRLGNGMPPRLRGKRFSNFVDGHARIVKLEAQQMYLHFDSKDEDIGPVALSEGISALLQCGDVIDAELGMRGDTWLIVDVGPVYPASIYVEAEEFVIK